MIRGLRLFSIWVLACNISFAGEWVKEKDIVIYEDAKFYSAFPSIVVRPDGEVLVAFRRAPERKVFGEKGSNHTDPNSYLVLTRSKDHGESWSSPTLIHAHAYGGSQDPCMVQLSDGSIVCSSYAWAQVRGGAEDRVESTLKHGTFVFMGGYLVRSEDGGLTWSEPIIPPVVPGNVTQTVFDEPCPAYNRGAMAEGPDGRLYWAMASQPRLKPKRLTEVHLLISEDGGLTWKYSCPIAQDEKASFNETSLYWTPKGTLVAFMRTADFGDHTVIARSKDGGKSFEPWEDSGFQGHPHSALRLPDDRVFLVYGYRHKPYGIRARILNAECTDYASAEEIVLREDGGSGDLGYPWAAMLPNGKVLAAYYFNKANGTRHIAGTVLQEE